MPGHNAGWSLPRLLVAVFVTAVVGASTNASLDAAPPSLTRLFPAGGQRGTTQTITCEGEFTWPVAVHAPELQVALGEKHGVLEVTIPAYLPNDRAWIRLYNAEGASTAMPLLIGNLPEIEEQEPNDAPDNAQFVACAQATVNAVLQDRGDVDAYAVKLDTGQTLAVMVDANQRLGSPVDAIVQVTAADGTVLAENHDQRGLDPGIEFTAAQAGTYLVRVFGFPSQPDTTISFRGGKDYIYRLTMTTGPLITHATPLCVTRNASESMRPVGANLPEDVRLPLRQMTRTRHNAFRELETVSDSLMALASQWGMVMDERLAGSARVRLVPYPVSTRDPRETTDSSVRTLSIPHCVTACLQRDGQVHEYSLSLSKGQPVLLTVESLAFDLPTVPAVQWIAPDGKVVAETPERGAAKDAVLTHSPNQDGEYRVLVQDRFGHGGSRYLYCLSARAIEPDFELAIDAEAWTIDPTQELEVNVAVKRHGSGDTRVQRIAIDALHLPPGVTARPVVSEPEGDTAEKVKLVLAADGKTSFSGPIRVRGSADSPRELTRYARTPARLGASFETVWLTVREAESATGDTQADTQADSQPANEAAAANGT